MAASIRSASAGAGDIDLALEGIAGADADCIGALTCGRSSFSYHRLPEPRLRLTIRKLDASCFDVQIARSAAVWELKAAIEGVFIALYNDTENAISWQHVWSHFCLCFKDEKLTDDKATLRAFGIRDGDELHFAQHLSVDYNPCKSLSKNHKAVSHRRSRTSLDDFSARSTTFLDDLIEDEGEKKFTDTNFSARSTTLLDGLVEDEGEKKFTDSRHSTSILEEGLSIYHYSEECIEEGRKKGGSFFRGWFSYSKLRGNRRTHSEDVVQSSCEKRSNRPKLGKWLSSKKSKPPKR